MAGYASFVVGSAVTTVATGRIDFAFNLMKSHEVSTVRQLTVRTVAVFDGWLHLDLAGVAIGTK